MATRFAGLAGQIQLISALASDVAAVWLFGCCSVLGHGSFFCRQFPQPSAIGVAVFGFVLFAVGLADAGRLFGFKLVLEFPLLSRRFLLGPIDIRAFRLRERCGGCTAGKT